MTDDAFWQRIIESGMAVPADRPLTDLTAELVEMLGTSDPLLRDGVAYEILDRWIADGVYDDLLASLGDSVSRGLAVGLGDDPQRHRVPEELLRPGADLVHRAGQPRAPAAGRRGHALGRAGLSWFAHERDDRGWVEGPGGRTASLTAPT